MVEVNPKKTVFKTIYPWAFCLNAKPESKLKHYFLPTTLLNCQKLQKLVPNYNFSSIIAGISSVDIKPPLLRGYQLADVKFLSRIEKCGNFQ